MEHGRRGVAAAGKTCMNNVHLKLRSESDTTLDATFIHINAASRSDSAGGGGGGGRT